MKKKIIIPAMIGILAGSIFSACENDPNKKIERAQANVEDAKQDLTEAQIEARNENFKKWQDFRTESEAKIRANEEAIRQYKEDMYDDKKNVNVEYNNKISDLERKNKEMRVRIETYYESDNTKWDDFKREFTHDMDEIARSLSTITEDNVKDKNNKNYNK